MGRKPDVRVTGAHVAASASGEIRLSVKLIDVTITLTPAARGRCPDPGELVRSGIRPSVSVVELSIVTGNGCYKCNTWRCVVLLRTCHVY